MSKFKLDRNSFKIQSHKQADNSVDFWRTKTPLERIQAAWYLISKAFGISNNEKLDKNMFKMTMRA